MEKIKAVIKEVDQDPKVMEIDNDIHFLQKEVGGLIDITTLPNCENVDIIVNDDFIAQNMPGNFMMPECDNVIGGNAIFVGYDPETGDSISLSDRQVEKVLEYLEENSVKRMDLSMTYFTMKAKEQCMGSQKKTEMEMA
jgi:hypothetical protein